MRIFALSDIHVDYDVNAKWVANLSRVDYSRDALILAGDVTDSVRLLEWCLSAFAARFKHVFFVPGNHDLWVLRDKNEKNSLRKFQEVNAVVESVGASTRKFRGPGVTIIPLFGWYDHSFGEPSDELKSVWMDYHACRWPAGMREREIASYFSELNDRHEDHPGGKVITFSHFLPRIDLMPNFIPAAKRLLYPVLGAPVLESQLRALNASIHIYGHSHVNRRVTIDGVSYINNAFGYPGEASIASKRLVCVYEC